LAIQEDAMKDPMKFVEKLQRGEDLGIPERQVIAEVSNNVIRIFGWVTIVSKSDYCASYVDFSSFVWIRVKGNDSKCFVIVRGVNLSCVTHSSKQLCVCMYVCVIVLLHFTVVYDRSTNIF